MFNFAGEGKGTFVESSGIYQVTGYRLIDTVEKYLGLFT